MRDRTLLMIATCITVCGCLPFCLDAELNWDESTFIVMADQLLKGNLPFIRFWDIKPPLVFFYMAGVLGISKSIIAVRFAATLLIAMMVFSSYALCRFFIEKPVRPYLLLIMACVAPFMIQGPWNTTEHLAVIPLSICFCLVLAQSPRPLLLGVCGALVVLARTNLLPVVCLVFLWSIVRRSRLSQFFFRQTAWIVFGFALPIAVLMGVYAYCDGMEELYRGQIKVLLAYADYASKDFPFYLKAVGKFFESGLNLDVGILWILGLVGLYSARHGFLWLNMCAAVCVLSILHSGHIHAHYLIQLFPFLCVYAGLALQNITWQYFGRVAVAAAVVSFTFHISMQGHVLYRRHQAYGTYADTAEQVTNFLKAKDGGTALVFFFYYHIGYFLLNQTPPTALIHPSNFGRPLLVPLMLGNHVTPEMELHTALDRNVKFIVSREGTPDYLKGDPALVSLYESTLLSYAEVFRTGEARVYQRRE